MKPKIDMNPNRLYSRSAQSSTAPSRLYLQDRFLSQPCHDVHIALLSCLWLYFGVIGRLLHALIAVHDY